MRGDLPKPVTWILLSLGVLAPGLLLQADEAGSVKVGRQPDGSIVVPTNQVLKLASRRALGRPGRAGRAARDAFRCNSL